MKKILLLLFCLFFGLIQLHGQTLNQSLYVDFGTTGGTNGAITPSPDTNDHYWNNATNGSVGGATALVNANNVATTFNLTVTDNFSINTFTNNGTLAPTTADLGDLAIKTATADYFYLDGSNTTGQLKISNLSPTKGYKFSVFASRPAADGSTRESKFVFKGATSFTDQIITTDINGGNITKMLKTPLLFPNASGEISIDLSIVSGGFAYINAMKMEEYDIPISQSMYVDFGPTGGTDGAITPSPDANGHYWNNATNGSVGGTTALVNANSVATNFNLTVTDNFSINTFINYGALAPTTANLGDLAIKTATADYFYLDGTNTTGQLKLSNLSPSRGYKFSVFGSRPATDGSTRESKFVFKGATSFTDQIITTDISGGNITKTLKTPLLFPNASGEISIDLSIVSGGFAYINAMKMEEYDIDVINVTALQITGNDITTTGQTSQMLATVTPINASSSSVIWKVDNTNIATISNTGLVTPVNNGSVIVTATSLITPTISASKTITISNQITELYFSGTATENGDNVANALSMKMVTGLNKNLTNIFEIYTSLNGAGTFKFYTSKEAGATVYGAGSGEGTLSLSGAGIDPTETGPVLITVNLTTNTYSITPINWSVVGSTIAGSWDGDAPLTYQGQGIWSATINMEVRNSDTNPAFSFKANGSSSYTMHRVKNTANTVLIKSQSVTYNIPTENIDINYGVFKITLDLNKYNYSIACASISDLKISVMGSSVANGYGAIDNHGYAYQYGQLLETRFSNGTSTDKWTTSNISINGNNTVALLNRWGKDLVNDCSKYVIYGLSLGNEGIHENGKPSFDQFKANMLLLIEKAKQNGMIPVVMNNYTRGDYNETDYNYIKQMNMLIHEWDVPSINLLGAIDNGAGRWATGYRFDDAHPNDLGHTEFFYAIVPSLFDALEQEKPSPKIVFGTPLNIDNAISTGAIKFTPENIIHSFTTSFDVKTSSAGNIASFTSTNTAVGSIAINQDGYLVYTSPSGIKITGTTIANDNQWHKITLTHFYARGITFLYSDETVLGSVNENLNAKMFSLNPANAPTVIQYKNWFFYRSGMNDVEVKAMNNGKMLKSSLELYAPLDGKETAGDATYANLAQSTNKIDFSAITLKTIDFNNSSKTIQLYPNPVREILTIDSGKNDITKIEVYNALGGWVKTVVNSKTINVGSFASGIYIVKILYSDSTTGSYKIMKN